MNTDTDTYFEAALVDRFGISRVAFREIRKNSAAAGYWQKSKDGILWSEEGIDWLKSYIAGAESIDRGNRAENFAPALAQLRVKQVYKLNKRLLLCLDEKGQEQRVRVRNNENFVPGMVIPCLHQEGDLWTLNGRLPKRKGKGFWK